MNYNDSSHTTNTSPVNNVLDFSPDSDIQKNQAALPITRAALIPEEYTAKIPVITTASSHTILVPLAGLLLAVGLVSGGQVVGTWFQSARISPENFSTSHIYAVVIRPAVFLTEKTTSITNQIGDSMLQISAVALAFPREVGLALVSAASQSSDELWYYPSWLVGEIGQNISAVLLAPLATQQVPVAESVQSEAIMSVAAVGSLQEIGDTIAESITRFFSTVMYWITYYFDLIINNWQNFLFGNNETKSITSVNSSIDEQILREQIKNEVVAELQASINEALADRGGIITQTKAGQGLVVIPSAGSSTDAMLKSKIQSLFSDPVLVELDESRQTGVITPVFNNSTGENYIFVLTPIQY